MFAFITDLCRHWSALYGDSASLRTVVGFIHVTGLLIGGGTAIAEDRTILSRSEIDALPSAGHAAGRAPHSVVLFGLSMMFGSGVLLFAADSGTYLHSVPFWTKMTLVLLLLANGAVLARAEHDLTAGAWIRRQRIAAVSLTLWLSTTFAGMVLPNV